MSMTQVLEIGDIQILFGIAHTYEKKLPETVPSLGQCYDLDPGSRRLLWLFFVICVCLCHADVSVSCSLVATCWERAGLLVLLYVMFLSHTVSWVRSST